jgi:hypothetical protein
LQLLQSLLQLFYEGRSLFFCCHGQEYISRQNRWRKISGSTSLHMTTSHHDALIVHSSFTDSPHIMLLKHLVCSSMVRGDISLCACSSKKTRGYRRRSRMFAAFFSSPLPSRGFDLLQCTGKEMNHWMSTGVLTNLDTLRRDLFRQMGKLATIASISLFGLSEDILSPDAWERLLATLYHTSNGHTFPKAPAKVMPGPCYPSQTHTARSLVVQHDSTAYMPE